MPRKRSEALVKGLEIAGHRVRYICRFYNGASTFQTVCVTPLKKQACYCISMPVEQNGAYCISAIIYLSPVIT